MGSHVRGLAEARPALHVSCGFTLACWDAPQGLWRTRDAHNSLRTGTCWLLAHGTCSNRAHALPFGRSRSPRHITSPMAGPAPLPAPRDA